MKKLLKILDLATDVLAGCIKEGCDRQGVIDVQNFLLEAKSHAEEYDKSAEIPKASVEAVFRNLDVEKWRKAPEY